MKTCPHCGTRIPVDSRFCYYCMTSLDEKTPVKPVRRRLRLRVGALALACLVAGGLTAWGILALISGGSPETPPASSGTVSSAATVRPASSSAAASSEETSHPALASSTAADPASSETANPSRSSSATASQKKTSSATSSQNKTSSAASSQNKTSSAASSQNKTSSATSSQNKTSSAVVSSERPTSSAASSASTILHSGTTGDCQWKIDSNGILTISGPGATADYGPMMGAPWEAYALSVTAIRVEPGVTYLGSCAFRNLTIAKSVSLPDTLTGMGTAVFSSTGLASVSVPASITALPDHTFYYSDLTSVTLPDGLKTIGKNAFGDCYYLKRIVIPASVTEIGEEAFRANVTLVTTKGSAADRYAQENGLKVEYLN